MPTTNLKTDYIVQSQAQKEVTANEAFDDFDAAIAAVESISLAAADVTLTDAQFRNAVLEFTGVLPANRVVNFPAREKPFIVYNNTTGAYSVTLKVTGQTGVTIAQGRRGVYYVDGTDVRDVSSTFSAPQFTVFDLTPGAAVTVDWSNGHHQRLAINQNTTFTFSNPPSGFGRLSLEITQDGTGSRLATWPASVLFGADVTGATLSTAASKKDFIAFVYNATTAKYYCVSIVKGY